MECSMHPLVEAVHQAYATHLPLVLTPDAIWYCISSAIAVHINKHSEELRNKFVDHEGKKRIEVSRDDFVVRSQDNPWNEVVDEFCMKIKDLTKLDIVDKLQADYSTTTKVARVVSQIVIMDAMQSYFEYYRVTCCGIPEIRIMGNKEDWQRIKGWINSLFRYLDYQTKNSFCWEGKSWSNGAIMFRGLHTRDFKYHMNQVPFIWNYYGTEVDMLFIGGLLGVKVDKSDFTLKPVFGYAVTENKLREQKKPDWA